MKLNAALLATALMVSGTVLAQSSGPSADEATAGQVQSAAKKGDRSPSIDHAARAEAGTVGGGQKPRAPREHFP